MQQVTLEIRRDSEPSAELDLEHELTIGRDPATDLPLDDVGVSRHHARIRLTPAAPVVEDLGSVNGTFVNGELVRGTRRLAEGDAVQIGETEIAIRGAGQPTEIADVPAAPRPAPTPDERPAPDREPGFNWPAVAAAALGVLSLLLIFTGAGGSFYAALPAAIAAIVFGSIGRRASDRGQGLRGLAVAGRVLGVIATVIAVVAILALLIVNAALDASAQSLGELIDRVQAEIDGLQLPEEIPSPEGGGEPAPE